MEGSVPLPTAFLPSPGEPVVPWKDWKRAFSTYVVASGASEYTVERQIALLVHSLGQEGQRIYHSIHVEPVAGNPDTLESVLAVLDGQFGTRENVVGLQGAIPRTNATVK
jgi:hypothetical protein